MNSAPQIIYNSSFLIKKIVKTLILVFPLSVVLGCGEEKVSTEKKVDNLNFDYQSVKSVDFSYQGMNTSAVSDLEVKNAGIYTSILKKSSHSYLVKHQNLCPKLLQRHIDTSLISRDKEFLHGNYCDYYIYPDANQILSVDTHGANIRVSLVMPVSYILDGQSYLITESRRHVIRVEYDGIQSKPADFVYNITVNLQDK